ncbi:MAG: hypothetical protein ACI3YM_07480 [Prevotella sp.]
MKHRQNLCRRHGQMLGAMLSLAALLLPTSCENEAYDSGTGALSLTQGDFVEVYTNKECQITNAETDQGQQLTFTQPFAMRWANRPDTTYRAILYYDLLDKNNATAAPHTAQAHPVSIAQVATLTTPIPIAKVKEMHTDPVRFESAWMSKEGKYLNLGFYLLTADVNDSTRVQQVSIVSEGISTDANGRRTASLRLYHDQGGVPEYYSSKKYISLICTELECDSVSISINSYQGETKRVFAIR